MGLEKKHCKPCEKETSPLSASASERLNEEVENWLIEDDRRLEKTLVFKDWKVALEFVNKVGEIAELENHHPNISIFDYKKVKIELYTHAIGGLSENDFILAAKIDELMRSRRNKKILNINVYR